MVCHSKYLIGVLVADREVEPSPNMAEDSVAEFVADLRALWVARGRPKFTAMANRVDASRTSLNDAVNRTDRLPSEHVLIQLLACLDPPTTSSWLRRRSSLSAEASAAPVAAPAAVKTEGPQPVPPHPSHAGQHRHIMLVACLAVAVGMITGGRFGFHLGAAQQPAPQQPVAAAVTATVADGTDPQTAGCVRDATTVAARSTPGVGTVKLVYSTSCNAFWAKVERDDDEAVGNKVEAVVYQRDRAAEGQRAVEVDVSSAYTFVLVRGDLTARYCARGRIWSQDSRSDLGGPVC